MVLIGNKLNCLTDCQADCCRCLELSFPFSDQEVEMLVMSGSKLERVNSLVGPLYKLLHCGFLKHNQCMIHNKPEQPKCCRETKPGSSTCLFARKTNRLFLNEANQDL